MAIHIALLNKSYDISWRTPFVSVCEAQPSPRVKAQRDLRRADFSPEVATLVEQLETAADSIRTKYSDCPKLG